MKIFKFIACYVVGHDDVVVKEDVEHRLDLIECTKCHRFTFKKMWFQKWWRLITDEQRRAFLDERKHNVLEHNPLEYDEDI